LATLLNVKYALIGELNRDRPEKVITLALWVDGELAENIEYDLRDSPCENVWGGKLCYYPKNIQKLFPKDQQLPEMGIESYLGVPLHDSDKKCGGLLVVMHDKEISESLNPEAIMQVIGNRIEAELERHKAAMELEKHLYDLEKLVGKRTAALKKSNQSLSDFASIASHDLQEPLRKVMMFGDRLKELNQNLDEKSCDYIDRMQSATFRMQSLINDLLEFSKLTTEDSPFVKIDFNKIIEGTLSDLEARIDRTQGTINVDTLPEVEAYPVQMYQLFQNMVCNALKYRKDDVDPVNKISLPNLVTMEM